MYHVLHILGVISPHPPAMPGSPKNQELDSEVKNGIHINKQSTGEGEMKGQNGENCPASTVHSTELLGMLGTCSVKPLLFQDHQKDSSWG